MAAPAPPGSKIYAAVRVNMLDRDGTRSHGTGTVIDRLDDSTGIVATNWHVVRDSTGHGLVQFLGAAGTSAVEILEIDQAADVALLYVSLPAGQVVCELADRPPAIGQVVTIAGYGADCVLVAQRGQVVQYTTGPEQSIEAAPCSARQGDSGGPMFDADGKLSGVLWGAHFRRTHAAHCGIVRRMLVRARARIQGRRARRDEMRAGKGVRPAVRPPVLPSLGAAAPAAWQPIPPPAIAPPPNTTFADGSGPRPIGPDPNTPTPPADTGAAAAAAAKTERRHAERLAAAQSAIAELEAEIEKLRRERPAAPTGEIAREAVADVARAAAPGLIERFAPGLLAAVGVGGPAAAALYVASRLLRRRAAKRAHAGRRRPTAATDGAAAIPSGGAPQPTHEIKFVAVETPSAELAALLKAIEVLGTQSPAGRKFAMDIQSYKSQLLNRA